MGWLSLIIASTLSAAIIMYVLWPTSSGAKQRKALAILLASAAFILPAGLKYFFAGDEAQVAPDISGIVSQLPASDSALWSGELTQPSASSGKDLSMSAVTARLEEKLRQNPDNIGGWILLGRSYIALGESEKAIKLFEDRIKENPENIDLLLSYGESLSKINQGVVTEKARDMFIKAHALDIKNPRTGYNIALYEIQNQQYQQAHDRLKALLDDAQAGAPYLEQLKEQIAITGEKLGLTPAPTLTAPVPGPTPEQVTSAGDMSPQDRNAFINLMVNNLANKLAENPDDLQGWLRLGKSYGVLGQWQKSAQAYQKAMSLDPNDLAIKKLYDDAQARTVEY